MTSFKAAKRAVAIGLTSALLAFSSSEARANGRFPESNGIFFAPSDPNLVLLRVTFGLMLSHDRGATWDWVCERSIGLAGIEDPMFNITPAGTFLGSTFSGVTVSRDQGCSFDFSPNTKDYVFIDLTSRPSEAQRVVAFASSYDGQDEAGAIFFNSALYETTDEGVTFTKFGATFDPTILGETVDLTPSDPDRVYVTGVRGPGETQPSGVFLTSHDRGKTYEETPIALVPGEKAPYIAGVDPTNADRVYVRTYTAVDRPSRLLVSDDAGKTFRVIFTAQTSLAGFALSPDGKKIWVGSMLDGLHYASTTDFAFEPRSRAEISCLAYASDGLWACSNEKSGFVAGRSNDEGHTFETKLHFCDARGPLGCAVGSVTHTECHLGGTSSNRVPPWPPQRALLGCNAGLDAGPDAAGGEPPVDPGGDDGGCSFAAPSASPVAAAIASLFAIVAIARRRRRASS
ncbi:MAG: hypothetical protein KF819_13340 [Labilithrix sp.]|nr:hypothetical protein [Labilithrix sp.]